jgi:hypothetical protein
VLSPGSVRPPRGDCHLDLGLAGRGPDASPSLAQHRLAKLEEIERDA